MNKKVLIAMIVLTSLFLTLSYVLKIFYPQEFVMAVENENIIIIGEFIDNHAVLYYLFAGITAFITYWLYCSACSHRLKLKIWECLVIVVVVVLSRLINFYDATLAGVVSTIAFIALPAIMNADMKTCTIVYSIHLLNQALTLSIRNISLYVQHMSSLVITILAIDMYFWLILFYAIFNYKKQKKEI